MTAYPDPMGLPITAECDTAKPNFEKLSADRAYFNYEMAKGCRPCFSPLGGQRLQTIAESFNQPYHVVKLLDYRYRQNKNKSLILITSLQLGIRYHWT
jgi:hypothetical protein